MPLRGLFMHKQILKFFKKPEQKQYDKKQLKEGTQVESEHTKHPEIAERIAQAHLSESPDYYKKLKIMERVKLSDMKKLVKHDWSAQDGFESSPMHGWIHPNGQFYKMGPNESHDKWIERATYDKNYEQGMSKEGALDHGWIAVGHTGANNFSAHDDVIKEPHSPAMKTLRTMLGKHYPGHFATAYIYGKYDRRHDPQKIDVEHFERHGTLKPWEQSPFYKSESVKAEDSSKQTIEVTLDSQLLIKLLSDLEVTNQISLDIVLGMYPPFVYSKIKHLVNQENVITHDTLDRFILGLPKKKYHYDLTPISDFNANVEKQNALEIHANSFEPDEHVDRSNHIDTDKSIDFHVSNFNPIDYIDRNDYIHSMEEAKEMAQHKHYVDHIEMAKDQGHSFEDGKLFRAKHYQNDLDKAKENHLEDFDPNQYQHNDDLMLPEYHDAVAKAKQDHMSNFDASDIDGKEKAFQEVHGVSSDTPRFEFTLYVHPDMESQIRAENLGDIFDLIYQDSHFVENDNQKIIGWLRTDGQDLSDCFPSFYISNLIDGFVKLSVRKNDLAEKYWRIWSILLQNLQPNQVVCEAQGYVVIQGRLDCFIGGT